MIFLLTVYNIIIAILLGHRKVLPIDLTIPSVLLTWDRKYIEKARLLWMFYLHAEVGVPFFTLKLKYQVAWKNDIG